MYIKKLLPHTFFVLLNIVMILATLFSSAAYPIQAHALGTLITVNTTSDIIVDDNLCSLPEAIENANLNSWLHQDCAPGAANDTIDFDNSLGTATITLASLLPTISDTAGLTINGGGDITISGNNLYIIFLVNSNVPLTLISLTVTAGKYNGYGGGINNAGTLTIMNSTFSGNTSVPAGNSGGGGIANSGTLTITGSTFSGNSTLGLGGGIYNAGGIANISNSTFSGNTAEYGGAIVNYDGTLNIMNSTISGNVANYGGGISNGYLAGVGADKLTIKNSTFNGNTAIHIGGGIYNLLGQSLNLYNTILANSSAGDCVDLGTTVASHNIIEDTGSNACSLSNGLNGNIIGTNPNIGALTGSPAYFPLLAGSPAINAGDDTICAASPVSNTSQNGVSRLQGPHCDIGSYELPDANGAPTVSSIVRVNPNPTNLTSVDFAVTFSESVTGVDASDFKLTTSGTSGAVVSGFSGAGNTYTVTVNTGTTNGSIRLDAVNDGSIKDVVLNPLAAGFTSGEAYTVVRAATFADVPSTYWASSYIERLYNAGITGGCSTVPLNYCPDNTVTRAQMAVFLLKGMHGSSFTPPDVVASSGFSDVTTSYWAAAWIKQLAAEGITGGCGAGIYCPDATVTRAQMAVFLLKAKHGSTYSPPAATGVFTDVSISYWAAAWIEQLATEGVTSGCGAGIYCPDADVTRAQMAVFLVKAFNLP